MAAVRKTMQNWKPKSTSKKKKKGKQKSLLVTGHWKGNQCPKSEQGKVAVQETVLGLLAPILCLPKCGLSWTQVSASNSAASCCQYLHLCQWSWQMRSVSVHPQGQLSWGRPQMVLLDAVAGHKHYGRCSYLSGYTCAGWCFTNWEKLIFGEDLKLQQSPGGMQSDVLRGCHSSCQRSWTQAFCLVEDGHWTLWTPQLCSGTVGSGTVTCCVEDLLVTVILCTSKALLLAVTGFLPQAGNAWLFGLLPVQICQCTLDLFADCVLYCVTVHVWMEFASNSFFFFLLGEGLSCQVQDNVCMLSLAWWKHGLGLGPWQCLCCCLTSHACSQCYPQTQGAVIHWHCSWAAVLLLPAIQPGWILWTCSLQVQPPFPWYNQAHLFLTATYLYHSLWHKLFFLVSLLLYPYGMLFLLGSPGLPWCFLLLLFVHLPFTSFSPHSQLYLLVLDSPMLTCCAPLIFFAQLLAFLQDHFAFNFSGLFSFILSLHSLTLSACVVFFFFGSGCDEQVNGAG